MFMIPVVNFNSRYSKCKKNNKYYLQHFAVYGTVGHEDAGRDVDKGYIGARAGSVSWLIFNFCLEDKFIKRELIS